MLNTPSHHRVHHASDLKYLDKNHAGVLIIWDRLFRHLSAGRRKACIRADRTTSKPITLSRIATHEWAAIGKDLRKARTWRDAWHYLFRRAWLEPRRQQANYSGS